MKTYFTHLYKYTCYTTMLLSTTLSTAQAGNIEMLSEATTLGEKLISTLNTSGNLIYIAPMKNIDTNKTCTIASAYLGDKSIIFFDNSKSIVTNDNDTKEVQLELLKCLVGQISQHKYFFIRIKNGSKNILIHDADDLKTSKNLENLLNNWNK